MSSELFDKLENGLDAGTPPSQLKGIVIALRDQWDALEERLERAENQYAELAETCKEPVSPVLEAQLDDVLVALLPMKNETDEILAKRLGFSVEKTVALLQELQRRCMVTFSMGSWEPSCYYILPSGRNYLLRKGLIP